VTGSQFHQVTYRKGAISASRFTADGQNIIENFAFSLESGSPLFSEREPARKWFFTLRRAGFWVPFCGCSQLSLLP